MINVDSFLDNFMNEKGKPLIRYGKVDPNYSEGDALVIYDIDKLTNTLSKVIWPDHITPVANKSVMVISGIVVAQYDRRSTV